MDSPCVVGASKLDDGDKDVEDDDRKKRPGASDVAKGSKLKAAKEPGGKSQAQRARLADSGRSLAC